MRNLRIWIACWLLPRDYALWQGRPISFVGAVKPRALEPLRRHERSRYKVLDPEGAEMTVTGIRAGEQP